MATGNPTLGTFLRSFRWGHVRWTKGVSYHHKRYWAQRTADSHLILAPVGASRVSRKNRPETRSTCWPGPGRLGPDTPCGRRIRLAKEGAYHHNHPLLAIAAGTGDVLMSRLREGRANTARGAAHFLRETVSRVRYGGASGQLTMRADSGYYTHAVVSALPRDECRFSITIRQSASLRSPYPKMPGPDTLLDGLRRRGGDRVGPTPRRCGSAGETHARFPVGPLDREGQTLDLEADHRRHAEIENAIRDLKYGVGLNHLPSGRFAANGACGAGAGAPGRWTARLGLGEQIVTKTLRRRFFSLAGRLILARLRPPFDGALPLRGKT